MAILMCHHLAPNLHVNHFLGRPEICINSILGVVHYCHVYCGQFILHTKRDNTFVPSKFTMQLIH
jgi:hypothetical protein